MMRASTTPSIRFTSFRIRSATLRALFMSLPVMRTLIGVDLPSFMADRTMPPASKANSRSENCGSAANPCRKHVDVLLGRLRPLGLELNLHDRVHRPGVRREGGRPVRRQPDLADDQFQVVASLLLHEFLRRGDLLLGLFDPRAGRGPDEDLERAGIDFREELPAQVWAEAQRRPRPGPRTPPPITKPRARRPRRGAGV